MLHMHPTLRQSTELPTTRAGWTEGSRALLLQLPPPLGTQLQDSALIPQSQPCQLS